MTIEEAKKIFLNRGFVEVDGGIIYDPDAWRQALSVISDWFKSEPCENAISRKALINHIESEINEWGDDYDAEQILGDIEDMPSIQLKQKTGHWIYSKAVNTGEILFSECSACGYGESRCAKRMNYCPNCGAKMIEPQESEDEG